MKKKKIFCGFERMLFLVLVLSVIFPSFIVGAGPVGYDTTRIFKAMAKARSGENITIGVIGGSITAGSLASSESKRWANLMADWWETTFPDITVTLVNAGIGGTGSDIGTHRVQSDLLKYNPDFVVVEFAVNDEVGAHAEKMMEGLVQQILVADSLPGLMVLALKQVDGTSAINNHKKITDLYSVPLIDFPTLIDSAVAKDGIELASIYGDGTLHPNDIGMAYIAGFIKAELNKIYNKLPDDIDIPAVNTTLPAPLHGTTYSHTYMHTPASIVHSSNSGWDVFGTYWMGNAPDEEITFEVEGNAISLIYTRHNDPDRGQVEAWVDGGTHITLDAYWEQTWGPGKRFALVAEGLSDGVHTLHIKVTSNNSAGSTGHEFPLYNVLLAGEFGSIPPISNAGANIKTLTNTTVSLIGTAFDPDNDTIKSYEWSIIAKPVGSSNTISNATNDTASFIPDVAGYYIMGFVVGDGVNNSIPSKKFIHAVSSNQAPVADAGKDTTIAPRQSYNLDGSGSYDDDKDSLSYSWRVISQPAESNVFLENSKSPIFKSRFEGEYKIGLVVNDSISNSDEDEVIITVSSTSSLDHVNIEDSYFITYPNPVTNELNIKYHLKMPGQTIISVYDVSGQTVFSNKIEYQETGTHSVSLNIDPAIFKKGMYLIMLENKEGSFSDKFVIE